MLCMISSCMLFDGCEDLDDGRSTSKTGTKTSEEAILRKLSKNVSFRSKKYFSHQDEPDTAKLRFSVV